MMKISDAASAPIARGAAAKRGTEAEEPAQNEPLSAWIELDAALVAQARTIEGRVALRGVLPFGTTLEVEAVGLDARNRPLLRASLRRGSWRLKMDPTRLARGIDAQLDRLRDGLQSVRPLAPLAARLPRGRLLQGGGVRAAQRMLGHDLHGTFLRLGGTQLQPMGIDLELDYEALGKSAHRMQLSGELGADVRVPHLGTGHVRARPGLALELVPEAVRAHADAPPGRVACQIDWACDWPIAMGCTLTDFGLDAAGRPVGQGQMHIGPLVLPLSPLDALNALDGAVAGVRRGLQRLKPVAPLAELLPVRSMWQRVLGAEGLRRVQTGAHGVQLHLEAGTMGLPQDTDVLVRGLRLQLRQAGSPLSGMDLSLGGELDAQLSAGGRSLGVRLQPRLDVRVAPGRAAAQDDPALDVDDLGPAMPGSWLGRWSDAPSVPQLTVGGADFAEPLAVARALAAALSDTLEAPRAPARPDAEADADGAEDALSVWAHAEFVWVQPGR